MPEELVPILRVENARETANWATKDLTNTHHQYRLYLRGQSPWSDQAIAHNPPHFI